MKKADIKRLFQAVERNDVPTVTALLDEYPEALEAIGEHNNYVRDKTPLMYALQSQEFDLARLLLKRGANAAARMPDGPKDSVLQICCYYGAMAHEEEFVEWVALAGQLIDAGADPNDGLWPACAGFGRFHKRTDLIRLLLDRGADPDRKDNGKDSVRELVAINAHLYSEEVLAIFGVTGESKESKQAEPPAAPAPPRPFMEHPGAHPTAVGAMAAGIMSLRKLKTWNKWITFTGQGMGGRADSYKCAAIQMRQGNIRLPEPLEIDLDQLAKRARVPRDRIVRRRKDLYSIADATPRQAARIMDVLYRDYLGIRPWTGEGDDYGVIAEWL